MRARRVDDNQAEIVSALRKVGATVQHLHTVGEGCPDILVGWRHQNLLFEIKDGSKVPSKPKLTPDEVEWHKRWKGVVYTIESLADALKVMGVR